MFKKHPRRLEVRQHSNRRANHFQLFVFGLEGNIFCVPPTAMASDSFPIHVSVSQSRGNRRWKQERFIDTMWRGDRGGMLFDGGLFFCSPQKVFAKFYSMLDHHHRHRHLFRGKQMETSKANQKADNVAFVRTSLFSEKNIGITCRKHSSANDFGEMVRINAWGINLSLGCIYCLCSQCIEINLYRLCINRGCQSRFCVVRNVEPNHV